MRTYEKINSKAFIDFFYEEATANSKAKFNPEALRGAITYVCHMVAAVNNLDEYTHVLDMVDLDELSIPKAFGWMIQPKSIRIISSKKMADLRDRNCFFTNATPEVMNKTKWINSWNLIFNAWKINDKDVDSLMEIVTNRRSDKTYDETIVMQLVIDDLRIAPGLTEELDPIMVTYNPFRDSLVTEGFDDDFIEKKLTRSIDMVKKA